MKWGDLFTEVIGCLVRSGLELDEISVTTYSDVTKTVRALNHRQLMHFKDFKTASVLENVSNMVLHYM